MARCIVPSSAEYQRERYKRRRDAGLCVRCGKNASRTKQCTSCREAALERQKKYYCGTGAATDRQKHLLRKYGITEQEFTEQAARQSNLCAICEKPKKLVVDHSHKTNIVRGLLCRECNTGLGAFYDDYNAIMRAADYIREHDITGARVDMYGECQ